MSRNDLRRAAYTVALFVAAWVVFGLLRGHGVLIGAIAGLLVYGLVMGVGYIVERGRR